MKKYLKLVLLPCLSGCASMASNAASKAPPTTGGTENQIHSSLLWLNLAGVVGCAITGGLFIYAIFESDKPLEKIGLIGLSVAGALCAVTLTGLFVLPYVPYILLFTGLSALALAGYIVYSKWFAKKPVVAA